MFKITLKILIMSLLALFSATALATTNQESDQDPDCSEFVSPAFQEESHTFFDSLDVPEEVVQFLELNKPYTEYLMSLDYSSRAHAYFAGRVYRDWFQIKKYLHPMAGVSVLDIGSGIGGVDILFARHFPKARITLVDRTEKNGFNANAMAVDLIQRNANPENVRALEPGADGIGDQRYDLITSFRGLGYLFPFEAYRDVILETLKPRGYLVLDISVRKEEMAETSLILSRFGGESSGSEYQRVMEDIRKNIGHPIVIHRNHSYHRIIVRRDK